MKESLPKTLYDLVRAEQFVPFSILFATGQRFEIKTREHISLGPLSRSDVEGLKTLSGPATIIFVNPVFLGLRTDKPASDVVRE